MTMKHQKELEQFEKSRLHLKGLIERLRRELRAWRRTEGSSLNPIARREGINALRREVYHLEKLNRNYHDLSLIAIFDSVNNKKGV